MAETDDRQLARDLDAEERDALQTRIAAQLEVILETACDPVLAEYATVLVATEKKTVAEIREALAEMIGADLAAQLAAWLATELPGLEAPAKRKREDEADDEAAPARKGPIMKGPSVFPGRGGRGRGRFGRGCGRGKGRGEAEGNRTWVKAGHTIQSPKLDGALNAGR